MPYLCWIYTGDIQQGFIGINICAVDMLKVLPHGKGEISLIAYNSDYECRFILEYLQNVLPIVKSIRFLQVKATCCNSKAKRKINIIVKGSYKLIPMPLKDFGKCFTLGVNKEVMPYGVYTYENVNMGACSSQSALDILKDADKQHFWITLKIGIVS